MNDALDPAPVTPGSVVVAAGGHGREVWQAVRRAHAAGLIPQGPVGFLDDNPPDPQLLARLGGTWMGQVADHPDLPGWIGVGAGAVRERLSAGRPPVPAAVDPLALVGGDVELGEGAIVFAQATVTTNIRLGRHTHVGRGAAVGHDTVLDDFVSVMPLAAISGNVHVGARAFIGTGAVIRQGLTVGADAVVGMGAVVVKDVPAGATVVGNPARALDVPREEPRLQVLSGRAST